MAAVDFFDAGKLLGNICFFNLVKLMAGALQYIFQPQQPARGLLRRAVSAFARAGQNEMRGREILSEVVCCETYLRFRHRQS